LRYPPWPERNGRSPTATRESHLNNACGRHGPREDATSAEHLLPRTDGTRTAVNARAPGADRRGGGPSRPAFDRENQTRPQTGSIRSLLKDGTLEFDTGATHWPAR